MDRLISTAWRAFWIGLGASAVLIGQSLLAPTFAARSAEPATGSDDVPVFAHPAEPNAASPGAPRLFEVKPKSVIARIHGQS